MKLTQNFDLREFVHSDHYKALGDGALGLIDFRIVLFAQAMRDYLGRSVTVNNWHTGGARRFSGLRPFDSTVGAKYSQHKYGRACDIIVSGMTGDELREIVRKEYDGRFKGLITTIEQGTDTWLHSDCRHTGLNKLYEVPFWEKPQPKK